MYYDLELDNNGTTLELFPSTDLIIVVNQLSYCMTQYDKIPQIVYVVKDHMHIYLSNAILMCEHDLYEKKHASSILSYCFTYLIISHYFSSQTTHWK